MGHHVKGPFFNFADFRVPAIVEVASHIWRRDLESNSIVLAALDSSEAGFVVGPGRGFICFGRLAGDRIVRNLRAFAPEEAPFQAIADPVGN